MSDEKKWLKVGEVADTVDANDKTILVLIKSGVLPAVDINASLKKGRTRPSYRVSREALDEFLTSRAMPSKSQTTRPATAHVRKSRKTARFFA